MIGGGGGGVYSVYNGLNILCLNYDKFLCIKLEKCYFATSEQWKSRKPVCLSAQSDQGHSCNWYILQCPLLRLETIKVELDQSSNQCTLTWHSVLTLKEPITTAADDIFKYMYIYFLYFSKKISIDISWESCARQTIHMKRQDILSETKTHFVWKKKKKKSSATNLLVALRVTKV